MISVKYIYWFLFIDVLFQIETFLDVPENFFFLYFYPRTHCHLKQKLTMLQKYELNFPGILIILFLQVLELQSRIVIADICCTKKCSAVLAFLISA